MGKKGFMEVGFKSRLEQAQKAKFGVPANDLKRNTRVKRLEMMNAFGMGEMKRFAMQFDPVFLPGELQRVGGMALPDGVRRPGKTRIQVNPWKDEYDHPKPPKSWRRRFRNAFHYSESLEKRGFEKLGGGHYSWVFGKPGADRVVKVCHNERQDAYPMFAAWAHANPSPFLPKVYAFKRHQGFYVVVLERMEETVCDLGDSDARDAARVFQEYVSRTSSTRPLRPIKAAMYDAAFAYYPGIKDVLDGLRDEFNGLIDFDMHEGNWMVREDGSLVITDPISGATSRPAQERNERVTRIKSYSRALMA